MSILFYDDLVKLLIKVLYYVSRFLVHAVDIGGTHDVQIPYTSQDGCTRLWQYGTVLWYQNSFRAFHLIM